MLTKLKEFFVKRKKQVVNVALALAALAGVSLLSTLILYSFGIVYFESGDMRLNTELFEQFKNSWYGWIIIILFQIGITSLLSFIPGVSMAFIILLETLFENQWHAFLIAFIGVMTCSLMMYLLGVFGGYKLCKKLLGEEDCERASNLLNKKGVIFFPLMMAFPAFPDDALVMIAGSLKMSLKWFIPSVVLGRGIGIVTIVFGLGNIPFDKFTTPWHWVAFIAICAILIVAVFWCAIRLNKYLQSKNTEEETNVESKKEEETQE